jgi:hypothetical protein
MTASLSLIDRDRIGSTNVKAVAHTHWLGSLLGDWDVHHNSASTSRFLDEPPRLK